MQQITQYFKTRPWFLPLVPVFFVLHSFLDNFGFISLRDALLLTGIYCAGTGIVFLLFFLFYRNTIKAALITTYIMTVNLFFGAGHDFMQAHIPLLGKYSVSMGILLALFFILLRWLKKGARFYRPVLLLNLVLMVYVLTDAVLLSARFINPPPNKLGLMSTRLHYQPVKQAVKPDIWLLIFDEYASSLSLEQQYGYHNDLDAWLKEKGFSVQAKSHSNYSYTPASTASILNMSYISGITDSMLLTARDMNYCLGLIKNNEIIKFLSQQGYNIENQSSFELAGNPAPLNETLLPIKTRLITSNTLLARLHKDLGWVFFKGTLGKWLDDPVQGARYYNGTILQRLHQQAGKKDHHPLFVYGHVYMPHGPFIYDATGRLRDRAAIENATPAAYLDYLRYTNIEIKKLVSDIRQQTGDSAAIVLMGDHGYRYNGTHNLPQNFQNLNAVYLPGRDYHLFYDSVTCVNQFRVVFNSLFNQSIPLLKDSTIFLAGVP